MYKYKVALDIQCQACDLFNLLSLLGYFFITRTPTMVSKQVKFVKGKTRRGKPTYVCRVVKKPKEPLRTSGSKKSPKKYGASEPSSSQQNATNIHFFDAGGIEQDNVAPDDSHHHMHPRPRGKVCQLHSLVMWPFF
jgi:hypothetical protein